MDKQNGFENTEDFTELINDDVDMNTITETLELPRTENKYPEFKREEYNKDYRKVDDEFSTLVRKRDYKGFNSELPKSPEEHHSKKKKLKGWVYVLLLIILLGAGFGVYKYLENKKEIERKEEEKKTIENIKSHHGDIVKVIKDTKLFDKDKKEIGTVYKDVVLELDDEEIKLDTKYFHIKDLDFYISFEDVEKSEEESIDSRYKNYLPFNTNIVTKDEFTINYNDEKYITFNKSMEFPVIINNYNNKYYVEYNDRLVSISKDDVETTKENKNTDKKNQAKITTFAYHRINDTDDKCTDSYICLRKSVFDKQMKYLSDNNYFTLTMEEMYMYLKGNIQIEKGVTITFDDGYLFKAADEVLDKYGLNGTMFVITGDFVDKYDRFEGLKAIDIESHTHKMHKNYACAGGNQGGKMLCAGQKAIVEDMKKSFEAIKMNQIGFAYPFYDYNDTVISALKEVGIKIAFVGRGGTMGKATPKVTDVYKVPRMTVWEESLMSFNSWKSYL